MNFEILPKIFAALLLGFIWTVYLRKISIFSKIAWWRTLFPLIMGAGSVWLVIETNLPNISAYFDEKNLPLQYLIISLYNIALHEELCKFISFLAVAIFFLIMAKIRKQKYLIEEPSIIIYASLIALGFSTLENFIKFHEHGISSVYMRGMMSTVSHIIGTSIIAGFL